MIRTTYRVECEIMSLDPIMAANTLPECLDTRVFSHAQEAIDYARYWVNEFRGVSLPRTRVSRHANKSRLIFTCWRKFDGSRMEQRQGLLIAERVEGGA